MKRRALIIYCDNTPSGPLTGPSIDNSNFRHFLTDNLGGAWIGTEILTLANPTAHDVNRAVAVFLHGADYTLTVFTGHGFINTDNNLQYVEVADTDISIQSLISTAKRQSIIIDACRGYYSPNKEVLKAMIDELSSFVGDIHSTRRLFENAVIQAEEGITVLYSAKENQTSLDTDKGGAFLFSLLKIAGNWEVLDKKQNVLDLKMAHHYASKYLQNNFVTAQIPNMNSEKRRVHFPFAVKATVING